MVKRTASVTVVHTIDIEIDDSKFTEEFMEEFRRYFYPFFDLNDHYEHIGQLQARGIIDLEFDPKEFIEGYGPANEMGIKVTRSLVEVDDVDYATT